MLKVTITAHDSPVTIQDPRPVTQNNNEQAVVSVEPSTTREMIMQWGQLERIQKQLTDLANLDLITFVIEPVGVADGVSEFAEQNANLDAPSIDGVDNGGAPLAVTGSTFDVYGNYLLGQQVQAHATIAGDTALGSVLLESLNPGYAGNLYDFEVVDSGSGGLAVTHSTVDGRIVISIDLGGSASETCTGVAAAINVDMAGLVKATVVLAGATVIATAQAVTAFTGGVGTGLSVFLAGYACVVNAIDVTATPLDKITVTSPDVSGFGLTAWDATTLKIRSNDKLATASVSLENTSTIPTIDGVDNGGAAITVAGDTFDVYGAELLGGMVQASASVVADTGAGSILLKALNPGTPGNLYDFEIVDSGSGGLAVTHSTILGRVVISIDIGGSATETCTGVAAAINTNMAGLVAATVVGVGATTINALVAATPLTGGTGTGITVELAGLACVVDAIDISGAPQYKITVTSPSVGGFGLAAGDSAVLRVTANGKVATTNLTLV